MVHGIPRRIRQQMGIPHRHRDGLVPHQGLDPVDIGTCQSKPRAERVAERMEDNAILGAGTAGMASRSLPPRFPSFAIRKGRTATSAVRPRLA